MKSTCLLTTGSCFISFSLCGVFFGFFLLTYEYPVPACDTSRMMTDFPFTILPGLDRNTARKRKPGANRKRPIDAEAKVDVDQL